jgi:hypothetical protein
VPISVILQAIATATFVAGAIFTMVQLHHGRRARDTLLEWFQWLAERMLERESRGPVVPAYQAHANWRP